MCCKRVLKIFCSQSQALLQLGGRESKPSENKTRGIWERGGSHDLRNTILKPAIDLINATKKQHFVKKKKKQKGKTTIFYVGNS